MTTSDVDVWRAPDGWRLVLGLVRGPALRRSMPLANTSPSEWVLDISGTTSTEGDGYGSA